MKSGLRISGIRTRDPRLPCSNADHCTTASSSFSPWHKALDSSCPLLMVALDIAGAFDCVWHRRILAKLEQLGMMGWRLELFSRDLRGRSLRIVVTGCTSATSPVEASVPHGSILGPLLTTAPYSYTREEAENVIDATNRQLRDILAWDSRW